MSDDCGCSELYSCGIPTSCTLCRKSVCFNAAANRNVIDKLVRQPSSLRLMVVSSNCTKVANLKNASYDRYLRRKKAGCLH